MTQRPRINNQIRASELRVLTEDGEALGVLSFREAMEEAARQGLDLIEIVPDAKPPVAKIMEYGKFFYQQNKKRKEIKAKSHVTETKTVQVKIGTSEHDLGLKAKNISQWLKEGHRVKIDLYLVGRAKYTDTKFKQERLERVLNLITEEYKVASGPEKGPKGLTMVIERMGKGSRGGAAQSAPPVHRTPATPAAEPPPPPLS